MFRKHTILWYTAQPYMKLLISWCKILSILPCSTHLEWTFLLLFRPLCTFPMCHWDIVVFQNWCRRGSDRCWGTYWETNYMVHALSLPLLATGSKKGERNWKRVFFWWQSDWLMDHMNNTHEHIHIKQCWGHNRSLGCTASLAMIWNQMLLFVFIPYSCALRLEENGFHLPGTLSFPSF